MTNDGSVMTRAEDALPTQQRITDAALTLFAAKGFAATGIREIADAVGITTASLYHYMGTKEDLLVHIMTEGLTRFASAARLAVSDLADPARQLVAMVRVHVATEATQRRMSLVIDNEIRALTKPADVVHLRDAYEDLWRQSISAGVEAGAFHVADPALARLALLEMCNGVAQWFRPGGALTLAEVCDRFSDMSLSLIQARDRDPVEPVSVASLEMRSAEHEIAVVRNAYASFCSPELGVG